VYLIVSRCRQDSLVLEATGNALMGEQTWPSEAEILAGQGHVHVGGADQAMSENVAAADRGAGRDRRVQEDGGEQATQIPRGMSTYQADWFMDEEGKLDFNSKLAGAGLAGEAEEGGDGDGSSLGGDEDDDFNTIGGAGGAARSVVLNSKGVPLTKAERAEHDEQFPDEMDTPSDVAARVRFARYRALLSFRASPWHPKENLPIDYSRIFQFENFAGTQRRLLAEAKAVEQLQMNQALQSRAAQRCSSNGSCGGSVTSSNIKRKQQQQQKKKGGKSAAEGAEDDDCSVVSMEEDEEEDEEGEGMEVDGEGSSAKQAAAGGSSSSSSSTLTVPGAEDFVRPGQYIRLELEDVPAAVLERLQTMGHLLAYSLYEHEQKLSVLHFSVQKHKSAAESAPIKSKDELMFMVRQLDNILLFIYLI
jgi:hypothetical protein